MGMPWECRLADWWHGNAKAILGVPISKKPDATHPAELVEWRSFFECADGTASKAVTVEVGGMRRAKLLQIRKSERITKRSASVINVLLPDCARVPCSRGIYGASKTVERARQVLQGHHVDQFKSTLREATNQDVTCLWNWHGADYYARASVLRRSGFLSGPTVSA